MVEVGQRYHVDPGHLRRLPDERADRAAPHHHGSDEEAGPRGVVVEDAQDIARPGHDARFLAQFPQRRFPGGLARLAASAGQRPLSGVIPQAGCSPGDQQAGYVLLQKDAHHHRRGPQAGSCYTNAPERGQVSGDGGPIRC